MTDVNFKIEDLDFDGMSLPDAGSVPFEPQFYHEPRRPDVSEFSDKTKSRTNRNFNESAIIRLYMNNRITMSQYGAAVEYLKARSQAFPSSSHELKMRVDGGGSLRISERAETAFKRLNRCATRMNQQRYKALYMLLVDDMDPIDIGSSMGRGWGAKSINRRIGEVLDELADIWPGTKHELGG